MVYRWHIIPQLAVYTTYIPPIYIYCLLGGYMLPTTFYGNQKQTLKNSMNHSIISICLFLWPLKSLQKHVLFKKQKREIHSGGNFLSLNCLGDSCAPNFNKNETHLPGATKKAKRHFSKNKIFIQNPPKITWCHCVIVSCSITWF